VFVAIAIHHPAPEHADAFIEFMHRVVDVTEGAKGLQEFRCWREQQSGRLLGMSRWDSEEDFRAGLERITSLHGERRPEWTVAPDEVLLLSPA
jgi:heme-degrading monooxygenase HmoA